jgi:site-specific recombinase XerD
MSQLARLRRSRATRDWFVGTELSEIADVYVQHLHDHGYTYGTAIQYVECVAHFAHWTRRRFCLADINEVLIGLFLNKHLPTCRCAPRCQRARHTVHAGLGRLLEVLRSNGHLAAAVSADPPAIFAELRNFEHYLDEVRGLGTTTRASRLHHIRRFLFDQFGVKVVSVSSLRPRDIARFITRFTDGWAPQSRQAVCNSLRSYFRFRALQGEQTTSLTAALPTIASWRLAGLPKTLPAHEVKQFLGAFNRGSVVGRRDYAISRCLVDLGLRTAEVSRITLDDIDWRAGTLKIHGKDIRTDLLPLPRTTGTAIAAYLRHGRPSLQSRALFARHRAPLDAPVNAGIVRGVVRRTAERCGIITLTHGPHVLRHVAAQRLIQRGATLKDIADFLRHRCLDTAAIYTKVDLPSLSKVAMPWPGSRP